MRKNGLFIRNSATFTFFLFFQLVSLCVAFSEARLPVSPLIFFADLQKYQFLLTKKMTVNLRITF